VNNNIGRFIFGTLLATLFFSNKMALFILTYVFVCAYFLIQTILTKPDYKTKIALCAVYVMIMVLQLTHNTLVTFAEDGSFFSQLGGRIAGVAAVLVPFVVNGVFRENKTEKFYLPSVQDITVFTFNELIENIETVKEIARKGKKSFSKENLDELLQDVPRHNSFRYINKGSLTEEYFSAARQTVDDANIYVVISNTGSPASEIISLFTKKQYNHASLSFDRELKTIISYNGGERVYPPGLHIEMLHFFNKKKDSSIIVYRLPVTRQKKNEIIDKIYAINNEGNAYNVLGLVFKFSLKPNIMFCSQFVYKMLKAVDAQYFEKRDSQIKPTDLIELDYHRKLIFEYEIKFNEQKN
jgi:hypothetical protein